MKRYISLCLLVFGFHLMHPQTTATDGSVEFENSKKYIYQPETRLKLLQTAVAKGNANAMVDLGVLYYNGYGNFLKMNFEEAIKLWKAAEEKEHPIDIGAKSNVTQLYDNDPKLQPLVAQ